MESSFLFMHENTHDCDLNVMFCQEVGKLRKDNILEKKTNNNDLEPKKIEPQLSPLYLN